MKPSTVIPPALKPNLLRQPGKELTLLSSGKRELPKKFKRVKQEVTMGCFVASVASLIGGTYKEALNLIHPGKSFFDFQHGVEDDKVPGILKNIGFDVRKISKARKQRFWTSSKVMLLCIEWPGQRDERLCHAIIWDGRRGEFIDPEYSNDQHTTPGWYARHLRWALEIS